jgi:hypothetical protein
LKIDVEGAEYEMLLEDDGLLSFDIGSIVMEIDKNPREGIQHTFPELMDFLRKKFSNVAEKRVGAFQSIIAGTKRSWIPRTSAVRRDIHTK